MKALLISLFLIFHSINLVAQGKSDSLTKEITKLQDRIASLQYNELIQSMTQRSILLPGYFPELKALVARQAYNFWDAGQDEKLVSHLNIYKALHEANKYLGFDSLNQKFYNQIIGHTQSVVSIEFGSNPNIFYSAGSDGKVLKWNLTNLKGIPVTIYEGNHLIRSIDVSSDDQWLMILTKEGELLFTPLDGQRENPEKVIDGDRVQMAAFMPGNDQYVVITKDGQVKLKGYKVEQTTLGKTREKILSIAINPTTDVIYTGTDQGNLISWNKVASVKYQFEERFAVNTLAISSDLKTMAIGREKGDVILWDLKQDTLQRIISGHQSAVTDLDFGKGDSLLLTASRDRTTRIWDIHNPRKLPIVLDDHNDWVMTASFDKAGEKVITGSKDSFLRTWPVDPEVLADRICEYVTRPLTQAEWTDYVGSSVPIQATCPK